MQIFSYEFSGEREEKEHFLNSLQLETFVERLPGANIIKVLPQMQMYRYAFFQVVSNLSWDKIKRNIKT